MKTRSIYLIIAIILTVLAILLRKYSSADDIFMGINHWGGYLLAPPIAYYLTLFFSNVTKSNRNKSIGTILIGIIAVVLLSTDIANNYSVQKITAAIAGGGIIWLINRFEKTKEK